MSRKMTIARGLGRMKTIRSQLQNIISDIQAYSAWNNKKRHPLGQNNVDLKANHKEAVQKIESLYQQYNDLTKEFVKIKNAIDKANMETQITIGDKTMTINEALVYKRNLSDLALEFVKGYEQSVLKAEHDVTKYNNLLKPEALPEESRKQIEADILYLLPLEKVSEMKSFATEFVAEIDAVLNEVNAVTEIEIED